MQRLTAGSNGRCKWVSECCGGYRHFCSQSSIRSFVPGWCGKKIDCIDELSALSTPEPSQRIPKQRVLVSGRGSEVVLLLGSTSN